MEFERKKCRHKIYRSKYERNAPEIANWWYELFREMESEAAIPPDRRYEFVNDILPEEVFNKVASILTLLKTCKKDEGKENVEAERKKSSLELTKEVQRKEIGTNNPYTKFFRRRLDRAAIWHTLPPLSFEEMNLSQKAEAITTSIASDFVKWMESISDEDAPTSLTVPLVLKMFEIGLDNHASRSLQVRVKEMASVPDGVAILKELPYMAKRSQLHRQLLRDLEASQQKKRVFAFGRKLDKNYQILPPKMEEIHKWLVCPRIPQHLETMATVWQGITHLKSTRAYCEYLIEHPEITPPKYLTDMKMLDREALKTQKHVVAEEDGGQVTVPMKEKEKPTPSQEFIVGTE